MGRNGWIATSGGVVVVVALVGATVLSGWTPAVPEDGAIPLKMTTALEGPIAADVTDDVDPEAISRSPSGADCSETVRPAGQLYLCWQAYRDPHDGDPSKDYYLLRVHGTFDGETGTGVRWATVRAQLDGEPAEGVIDVWPEGMTDGACREVDVGFGTGPAGIETLCGRTTGSTTIGSRSHRVTWTCVGCLLPDHDARAIALREFVAVPAGTIPTWQIFADLGS
jgi:hypothetical protein